MRQPKGLARTPRDAILARAFNRKRRAKEPDEWQGEGRRDGTGYPGGPAKGAPLLLIHLERFQGFPESAPGNYSTF
jgi:hypothetical protein